MTEILFWLCAIWAFLLPFFIVAGVLAHVFHDQINALAERLIR